MEMINRHDKSNMMKTRHPSLEKPDPDVVKKKHQDILSKAKTKFFSLSEALKSNKILNGETETQRKPKSHATLDYLFKPYFPHKNQGFKSFETLHDTPTLQKQHSVGAYPIKIEITEDMGILDDFSHIKSATLPYEKREELRETAALALERPRKKLSFREPEISGYATQTNLKFSDNRRKTQESNLKTSNSAGTLRDSSSWDDLHLESQAMRVVRTIGQAFEVCHKLSITAPERNPPDQDEQDTLTQDLVSDHISDIISDRPKKDLLSETVSDRNSLPCEENILDDINCIEATKTSRNLNCSETVPLSSTNNTRKSHLVSGETYVSPLSDTFVTGGSGSGNIGNTTVFSTGNALSSHHEIQLLKEQLEQQSQQTQAALAQLQLVREQLAAEQGARMEAQSRTHQLLVHNKELLDHIAALVSHLQGSDKGSAQSHPGPHVAMPQQQQPQTPADGYMADLPESNSLEQSPIYQTLNYQNPTLIENRMVTNCLPPSPLRTTFHPSGSAFNFHYPTPQDISLESQLIQRLQALNCYPQYPYSYQPYIPQTMYTPPLLSNTYTLQPPPQKKISTVSLPAMQSYNNSPIAERKSNSVRNSEYLLQQDPSLQLNQVPNTQRIPSQQQTQSHNIQNAPSPQTPASSSPQQIIREPPFIKPLSQLGTLTTTDVQGRVRVIVPVPARAPDDDAGNLLASLRLGNELRPSSTITRSTSEKVPNRSELMSQVQRTAWARHTTK